MNRETWNFWDDIPEDCEQAIRELKRLKVYKCLLIDWEETFSDVWWLVLHEVDLYAEGEFCREASRSINHVGEPNAMNFAQAKRADEWLVKWLDLFNKYKGKECHSDFWNEHHSGFSDGYYYYDGMED